MKAYYPTAKQEIQKGMDWVIANMHITAQTLGLRFDDCHWKIDDQFNSDNEIRSGSTYLLVVAGKDHTKVSKIFSSWELENCTSDKELQGELTSRIFKIVTFVGRTASGQKYQ